MLPLGDFIILELILFYLYLTALAYHYHPNMGKWKKPFQTKNV